MKKSLAFLLIMASFAQIASAESFTYDEGQTYFASSLYATSSKPQYSLSSIGDNLGETSRIKISSQRIAQTFDYQYGYTKDLTLFAKVDVGLEKEKIYVQYDNPSTAPNTQFFSLDADYSRLLPEIGFRKLLRQDGDQLLSNQWTFYPGDIIFTKARSYQIHRKNAIGTRLQYARKFESDFFWSKYFKDYKNKEYDSYFEWEAGATYFPEARHFEFPLDFNVHFAAGANWGFGISLYNVFNEYYFDDKPYNNSIIAANARGFANMTTDDQENLINQIEGFRKSEGSSHSHQLNFKVSYYITRLQTIGLEVSTNVFTNKAFQNKAALLNYSIYF